MATIVIDTFSVPNSFTTFDTASRSEIQRFTATIAMTPFTSGFRNDVTDTSDRRDLSFTQGFFDKPSGSTASQFWS